MNPAPRARGDLGPPGLVLPPHLYRIGPDVDADAGAGAPALRVISDPATVVRLLRDGAGHIGPEATAAVWGPIRRAVSSGAVHALRPAITRIALALVEDLVEQAELNARNEANPAGAGQPVRFDVVADFARPLAAQVFNRVVGIHNEDDATAAIDLAGGAARLATTAHTPLEHLWPAPEPLLELLARRRTDRAIAYVRPHAPRPARSSPTCGVCSLPFQPHQEMALSGSGWAHTACAPDGHLDHTDEDWLPPGRRRGTPGLLTELLRAQNPDPIAGLGGVTSHESNGPAADPTAGHVADVITDEAILSALSVLASHGGVAAAAAIATSVAWIDHADRWDDLHARAGDVAPAAVAEALRLQPPMPLVTITSTLAPGDGDGDQNFAANLLAAHRNPLRYHDPHRFRLDRGTRADALELGLGMCHLLVIAQVETALTVLATQLPGLRVLPSHAPLTWPASVPAPSTLTVEFDLAAVRHLAGSRA